jgi:hypothetical protein
MSEIVDKPDVKTFDLGEFLAGRGYPEKTVSIFLDEAVGFTIAETNKTLQKLSDLGKADEYDALELKQNELIASLNERKLAITVRGIPRKVKRDIYATIQAKHKPSKDAFGREEFSQEAAELTDVLMWTAHIVQVAPANGSAITPSEGDIIALRDLAPMADLKTIQNAIDEIEEAGEGFEIASRSVDFLSKP